MQENRKAISMDYVNVLMRYAEQQGKDSQALLLGSNISAAELDQDDAYYTIAQYRTLLENADALFHDPGLGLKLGPQQHLATHGALGSAIMSSNSLDEAMGLVGKYVKIRNRLVHLKFFREGDDVVTQIDVKLPMDDLYQHVIELSFSTMLANFHSIVGNLYCCTGLSLRFAAPDHAGVYEEIFQVKPEFSAAANEMRFPQRVFATPALKGDPLFAKMAEKQCESLLHRMDDRGSLPDSIHAALIRIPGHIPSQEELARQFNMSKRSMSRQLLQLDTSFQVILNNTRKELSIQYLTDTDWTIEEIAYALDYESPPNFSRAFKKWTGKAPTEYRRSTQA